MSQAPTVLTSAAAINAARARLLACYRPPAGAYDELLGPGGAVRSHWEPLMQDLGGQSVAELQRRWETGRRFIRDQGIT